MKRLKTTRFKNKILNGFTLIELLVVISIIGILTGISLVSFTSSQRQARDTVRRSDLKQYQNALELFANLSNGLYPSRTAATASDSLCPLLNAVLEPDISCSADPKDLYYYYYISDGVNGSTTATKYLLWATLENKSTTTYWIVCSNGKNGESTIIPSSGNCPI